MQVLDQARETSGERVLGDALERSRLGQVLARGVAELAQEFLPLGGARGRDLRRRGETHGDRESAAELHASFSKPNTRSTPAASAGTVSSATTRISVSAGIASAKPPASNSLS